MTSRRHTELCQLPWQAGDRLAPQLQQNLAMLVGYFWPHSWQNLAQRASFGPAVESLAPMFERLEMAVCRLSDLELVWRLKGLRDFLESKRGVRRGFESLKEPLSKEGEREGEVRGGKEESEEPLDDLEDFNWSENL